MKKKFKPEVNGLIVFNDLDDAAIFRVKKIEGRTLTIVDVNIENMNPVEQFVDVSLAKQPTDVQLMKNYMQ